MNFAISMIAAAFYSVSSALLSRALSAQTAVGQGSDASADNLRRNAEIAAGRRRLFLIMAAAAVFLHSLVIINQTGLPHGLKLPLFTSIAATSLTIALLHIVLCLKQPADYLGIAVYPLAAISLIASHASGGGTEIVGQAVQIHVFLSLVAYAVLALAATQAILVSIQRHFLSHHKPGGFIRSLPPLDATEHLLFTLLATGFILLSLSLASGFFYLEDMFTQRLVHKTVLSCVGWTVFGVLLFGRWQFGWRGKKAVHWTLAGFAILVLAYFGSKLVIEILLR